MQALYQQLSAGATPAAFQTPGTSAAGGIPVSLAAMQQLVGAGLSPALIQQMANHHMQQQMANQMANHQQYVAAASSAAAAAAAAAAANGWSDIVDW
jgi:hypothetical protein